MSIHLSEYLPSSLGGSLIALVFASTPATVHVAKSYSYSSTNNNIIITADDYDEQGNNNNNNNNRNSNRPQHQQPLFPSANENFEILSNSPALSGGAIVDIRCPQLPFSSDCAPSFCSLWQTNGPRGRKCCALVTLSSNFDVHVMTCSLDGANILVVFKHPLSGMSKWLGERSAVFPSPPDVLKKTNFAVGTGAGAAVVGAPVPENLNLSSGGGGGRDTNAIPRTGATNSSLSSPTSTSPLFNDDSFCSLAKSPFPRPALSWFSPSTGALFFVPTVPRQSHCPDQRIFWFPYACLRRPIVSADGSSHLKMKKLYTNFDCPVIYFTVSEDTDTTGGNEIVKFSIVAALSAKHTIKFFCCPNIEVVAALESKPNISVPDPVPLVEFSLASLLAPMAPFYQLSVPSILNLEGFLSNHHSHQRFHQQQQSSIASSNSSVMSSLYSFALRIFASPNSISNSSSSLSSSSSPGSIDDGDASALLQQQPLSVENIVKILALAFCTSNSAHAHIFLSSLSHSIGPCSFMRIKQSPRGAAITRELSAAAFAASGTNGNNGFIGGGGGTTNSSNSDDGGGGWGGAQVLPGQFQGVGLCVCTDQIIHVLDCIPAKNDLRKKFHHQQFASSAASAIAAAGSSFSSSDSSLLAPPAPFPLFRYSVGGGLPLPHFLGVPFQVPEWANQRLVSDRAEEVHRGRLPLSLLQTSSPSISSSSSPVAPPARRIMFVVSKSNDQTRENHSSYIFYNFDNNNNNSTSNNHNSTNDNQQQSPPSSSSFASSTRQSRSRVADRNSSKWKYLCLCADNEIHEAVGVLVPFSGFPSAKIIARNLGKSPLQRIVFAPLESLNSHDQQILFLHTFDPLRDQHLLISTNRSARQQPNSNVRIAPCPASESHPRLDYETGKIERPLHAAYLFLGTDLSLQMGASAASRCVLFIGVSSMKVPTDLPSKREVTPSTNHFCIFAEQMNELDADLLRAQQTQAMLNLFERRSSTSSAVANDDGVAAAAATNSVSTSSLVEYLREKRKRLKKNSSATTTPSYLLKEHVAAEIDSTFPVNSEFHGKVERAVVDLLTWNTTPFVQYEESKGGSVTLLSVDVVDPLINVSGSKNVGASGRSAASTSSSSSSASSCQQRTVFYFVRYCVHEEGEDGSMRLGRECCLILVCSVVVHSATLLSAAATGAVSSSSTSSATSTSTPPETPTSITLRDGSKLQFMNSDFIVQVQVPDGHHHHHRHHRSRQHGNNPNDDGGEESTENSGSCDDDDDSDDGSNNIAGAKSTTSPQSPQPVQIKFSLRLRRIVKLTDVAVTITDHVACFKRTRPSEFINRGRNQPQQQQQQQPATSSSSSSSVINNSNKSAAPVIAPTTTTTAAAAAAVAVVNTASSSTSYFSANPPNGNNTNFPSWQVLDLRAFDASFVIPQVHVDEQTQTLKTDKVVEIPLSRLYASPWQDSFEESIVKTLACCSSVSRVFHHRSSNNRVEDRIRQARSKLFSDLYSSSSSSSSSSSFFSVVDQLQQQQQQPSATSHERGVMEAADSSCYYNNQNDNYRIGANINFHQLFLFTVRNPSVVSSFPGTLVLAWSATARCFLPMLTVHQRENGICCSFPFLLRHDNNDNDENNYYNNSATSSRYVSFVRPSPTSSAAPVHESLLVRPHKTTANNKSQTFSLFASDDDGDNDGGRNNTVAQQQQQQQLQQGNFSTIPTVSGAASSSSSARVFSSPPETNKSFISLCSPTLFSCDVVFGNETAASMNLSSRSVSGTTFLSDAVIIPEIFGDHSFAVVAATGSELSCVAFWGFSEASSASANINKQFLEDHVLEIYDRRRAAAATSGGTSANLSSPMISQRERQKSGATILDGETAQIVAPLQGTFRGEVKTLWSFSNNNNKNNNYCHHHHHLSSSAPIMQLSAGGPSSSSSSGGGSSSANRSAGAGAGATARDGPTALFVVALLTNGVVRCHSLTTGNVIWQLGTGASLPLIVRAESAASLTSGGSVCTLPDVIDFCGIADAPSKSHWVLARIGSLFPSLNWRPEPASSMLFSWLEWIQWCVTAVETRSRRLKLLQDPAKPVVQLAISSRMPHQSATTSSTTVQSTTTTATTTTTTKSKTTSNPIDFLDDMFGGGGVAAPPPPPSNVVVNNSNNNNNNNSNYSCPANPENNQDQESSSASIHPEFPSDDLYKCSQTIQRIFLRGLVATLRIAGETVNVSRSVLNRCRGGDNDDDVDNENDQKGEDKNANPISPSLPRTKFFVVPTSVAAILATMNFPLTALALVESCFPSKFFSSAYSAFLKSNTQKSRQQQQPRKQENSSTNNLTTNFFDQLFSSTPILSGGDNKSNSSNNSSSTSVESSSPETHVFAFATIAFWLDFNGQNEEATIVSLYVLKLLNDFTKQSVEQSNQGSSRNEVATIDGVPVSSSSTTIRHEKQQQQLKQPKLASVDSTLSILLLLTTPPNIAKSLNLWHNQEQQQQSHERANFWTRCSKLHLEMNHRQYSTTSPIEQEKPKENPQLARTLLFNAMNANGINHLWELLLPRPLPSPASSENNNNNNNNNNNDNNSNNIQPYQQRQQTILLDRFKTNIAAAFGPVVAGVVDSLVHDVVVANNNNNINNSNFFTLRQVAACGQQGAQFVADLDSRLLDEVLQLDKKYQDANELAKKKEKEVLGNYLEKIAKKRQLSAVSGGTTSASAETTQTVDGTTITITPTATTITLEEARAAFASTSTSTTSAALSNKKKNNNKRAGGTEDGGDAGSRSTNGNDGRMAIGGGGAGGLATIQIQLVDVPPPPLPSSPLTTAPNPISMTTGNNGASTTTTITTAAEADGRANDDDNDQTKQRQIQQQQQQQNPAANRLIILTKAAIEDDGLEQRVRRQVPFQDAAFSSDADNDARIPISTAIVQAAERHLLSQNYQKVIQATSRLKNGPEIGDNCTLMQIFLVARVLKLAKLQGALKAASLCIGGGDDGDDDEASSSASSPSPSPSSSSYSSPLPSFDADNAFGANRNSVDGNGSNKVLAADIFRVTCLLNNSALSNDVLCFLCEKLLPFFIEAKCGNAATHLMGLYRLTIESQIESGALSNEGATQKKVQAEQRVGAIDGLDGGEFEEKLMAALDGKVTVCVDSLRMVESSKAMKCFKCMSLYERKCVCV